MGARGPRRGRRSVTVLLGLALMAVIVAELPQAMRSATGPAPAASASAVEAAAATPALAPPLGPHGDDVELASEPPVDRAALAARARSAPRLGGYQWPLRNARITNLFGKGHPGGFEVDGVTTHDGIDLATWCGDRILAAHDGTVLAAGRRTEGFSGWVDDLAAYRAYMDATNGWRSRAIAIAIDDGNGYRSLYVHLGRVNVKAGDVVEAGDLIGWEGSTGNSTGCHLHYALFRPTETDTWLLAPDARSIDYLPNGEIARIDPLLVLPPLEDGGITWGWGVEPID